MAITKIHAIQATVHKAIAYICNPEKTDQSILISSFGCSPETAAYDFRFSLSKTRQSDPNKAFHLIQAFAPGEVSYEEAHQIGTELAGRLLEGRHSYIVSTHIDKGHIHNHIIFCAADHINHTKYHDCKKSYYHIRHLSDELCQEHHLSVIPDSWKHGKNYAEWLNAKNGTSWKNKLKSDIDEAIQTADSYELFLELLKAKGYEIKGADPAKESLRYISFRPLSSQRFIRGKANTLGENYTRERIQERIENRTLSCSMSSPVSVKKKILIKDTSVRKLIDTSSEKFQNSTGLKHWADVQNLKIAASSYSSANSIQAIKKQLFDKNLLLQTARNSLMETEHRIRDFRQILKYAEQYQEYRIYHIRYQKSRNPDAYLQKHESQLLLYDGAEAMLKRFGLNPQTIKYEHLRQEYDSLCASKTELQKNYHSLQKEAAAVTRKLDNLQQYLTGTSPKSQDMPKQNIDHPTL